jgi:hypothetical protein
MQHRATPACTPQTVPNPTLVLGDVFWFGFKYPEGYHLKKRPCIFLTAINQHVIILPISTVSKSNRYCISTMLHGVSGQINTRFFNAVPLQLIQNTDGHLHIPEERAEAIIGGLIHGYRYVGEGQRKLVGGTYVPTKIVHDDKDLHLEGGLSNWEKTWAKIRENKEAQQTRSARTPQLQSR